MGKENDMKGRLRQNVGQSWEEEVIMKDRETKTRRFKGATEVWDKGEEKRDMKGEEKREIRELDKVVKEGKRRSEDMKEDDQWSINCERPTVREQPKW